MKNSTGSDQLSEKNIVLNDTTDANMVVKKLGRRGFFVIIKLPKEVLIVLPIVLTFYDPHRSSIPCL